MPLLLLIRIRFQPFNPTYTTCYPAGAKGEGKPLADPKITKIETVIFEHDIQDMGHRLQRLQPRLREGQCPQDAIIDSADSYQYRGNR